MIKKKHYKPREYQPLVTDHILTTPRNAIWVPMGGGKTVSTLTAIDGLIIAGEDAPTLILAPLRVARSVWSEEAASWQHLRNISVMPIIGNEKERLTALRCDASVFTINYENIPWLVEYYGDAWPFKHVVSDESTKLKSYRGSLQRSSTGKEFVRGGGGMRTRALGRVAHSKITRFTELTGTPAPNGLKDLWGQMWFIDAGLRLGRTYEGFKERWFKQSYDGFGIEPLPHAQEEIQDKLRDVCLTIDMKDYFDVAEPIVVPVRVQLPPKARKLYNDMEKELFIKIENHEIEAMNAAAKSQKLLQITNGAVYLNPEVDDDNHPKAREWKEVHDVKLEALDEILNEANGMPMLVAYQFKSDLARLQHAFPKGKMLDNNPQTLIDWNLGKIPMLFVHPQSAGHGLNLQHGGNIIVFFANDWNLELRQQVIERIGPLRQLQSGYDRPVYIYVIVAEDTLDELVIERCNSKAEVQEVLRQAMKRRRT